MRLFASTRSPYVRLVLLAAHEAGLAGRIELVMKTVAVLAPDAEVVAHNPLGQIPTLVLDDGGSLYDSAVICEWIHQQSPAAGLIPAEPAARLDCLRRRAEADGLLDTLVRWLGERRRADHPLTPSYVAAHRARLGRVADHWERDAAGWHGRPLDLGFIAIGCALAYADFRFDAEGWRTGRTALADWHARIADRPSFRATGFRES